MILVQQTILAFREGTSDKVYEVDLCEVGGDQFVVNFRYGRAGAALREGSKTTSPVDRTKAEAIFDKLVQSKLKKGYHDTSAPVETTTDDTSGVASSPPSGSQELDDRARAVLARLTLGDKAAEGAWPLDRAIWRAGELAIRDAEPLLLTLLNFPAKEPQLRRYGVAWALGRCGSEAAIPALEAIRTDYANRLATCRVAGEALRQLLRGKALAEFIYRAAASLPRPLIALAKEGPAEEFDRELQVLLDGEDPNLDTIYSAYLISNEHTRPSVLRLCRELPIVMGNFQQLRHIYKAAEYRRDGEVFGILARRFEKEAAQPFNWWYRRNHKADVFFSAATREYFRRRNWRALRRIGELGVTAASDYCQLAVGVLLAISDSDTHTPHTNRRWDYSAGWQQPPTGIDTHYGPFAYLWAASQVLHHNSERYSPDKGGKFFTASSASTTVATNREEAFPELWDVTPRALLHLLLESACDEVHCFASKALRFNTEFTKQLDVKTVTLLVDADYLVTATLGYELAKELYDPAAPNLRLLGALANCVCEDAHPDAFDWIRAAANPARGDSELLSRLVLTHFADTREFAAELLTNAILSEDVGQALIGRLIAATVTMTEADAGLAKHVCDLLITHLDKHLASISNAVLIDLLTSSVGDVQRLAGEIAIIQAKSGARVPNDVLLALLNAENETAQATGVRLLEQLSDEELSQRSELLYSLATNEHDDVRETVSRLIGRVATAKSNFGDTMTALCLGGLRVKGGDGVHASLLAVLRDHLGDALAKLSKDEILKLLRATSQHAQELGGVLLGRHVDPADLNAKELVRLSSHSILSVREAIWSMCERSVERLTKAMATTTGLLDAKWEDSRAWARDFFRKNFDQADLSPEVLVAICDSVRVDVQAFGRELITTYFRDEDGQQYLVKLSEHPGESLQLFATNYLSRYASNNPARLLELEPYFVRVLSGVNKSRIAKERCLAFLETEGLANRECAQTVARILTRQSVTIAVQNKATMILSMIRLKAAYPDLDLPIQSVGIEHRETSQGASDAV